MYIPAHAFAACSPYIGQATLNEFFKENSTQETHADDFAEVKILNSTIGLAIYGNWKIKICEKLSGSVSKPKDFSGDGCSPLIPLSDFTTQTTPTNPWAILKDGTIGDFINMKTGFDAILVDGSGNLIDYFTLGAYSEAINDISGCALSNLIYDFDYISTGASAKSLHRNPDGTGDWGKTTSGADDGTSDDTNDDAPDGGTLPVISISNVTVNKGQTATFTFTMDKTVTYDVSVDYETTGGDAVPDTDPAVNYDYIYKTGTVTFPANTTTLTATIDISTNSATPSTTGTVYFYLHLFNQANANIINAYPIGTILGNATAEWYFDESSWNGTADEVIDNSSSTNHGTSNPSGSGPDTTETNKVLCRAGLFDGTDDYIRIPHDASIQGTNQLTYSVWVRPDSWSGSGINQIMSKSVHGGTETAAVTPRAQIGIFNENGELVGRAETADGRYNVYTSLPAIGSWTHVVLVFNGNSMTLYKNGVVADNISPTKPSSIVFNSTTLNQNDDPLMISKRVGTDVYYFDGYIDEVLVMQSALNPGFIQTMYNNYISGLNWNGAARSCPGSLHHIEFIHDETALTCNAEQVTVKSCLDASCSTLSPSSVTATLTPTGWVGGDSKTFTGTANYELQKTTAGTVTMGTSSVAPPASNPVVCKNSGGTVISCDITFSDSGFVFYNETDTNLTVPTQLSGKDSNIGYNAKDIKLRAVRQSDSDPTECVAAFQNKTLDIDFAAECISPTSCIVGQEMLLDGTTLVTNNDNSGTGSSSYDTRSITFDANGEYAITFNYPEAGAMELHARHNILVGGAPSGNYMSGSTSFVTRPFGLAIDFSGQRAADYADNGTLDNSTGTNLSYAADANGSVFSKAGENFVATLTAVKWQAADDTNNDGIPDSAANLSNNATTINFGKETTAVTPTNVTASHTTALPNTGTLTNSANDANFTNGIGTKTLAWSEVGIIDLTATLTNYLGGGQDIVTTAPSVGRFTPGHFCIGTNAIFNRTDTNTAGACTNNFNFLDEDFDARFTITAQPSGSSCGSTDVTLNYSSTWSKFSTPFSEDTTNATETGKWNLAAVNNPNGTPLILNSRADINTIDSSPTNGQFTNGELIVSARIDIDRSGVGPSYTHESALTDVHIGINPIDTDGIGLATTNLLIDTNNYYDVGTTTLYFGRLYSDNAYGPELTALPMWVQTQYCNAASAGSCTDWIDISNDSCTLFSVTPPADTSIGGSTAGDGSGYYKRLVGIPEFDYTNTSGLFYAPDSDNHNSGFNLFYTAGGTGGDYTIPFSAHPYLVSQPGKASFGLYRGDDRIIYQREVF